GRHRAQRGSLAGRLRVHRRAGRQPGGDERRCAAGIGGPSRRAGPETLGSGGGAALYTARVHRLTSDMITKPATLGELRQTEWASAARRARSVKDELRENLICLLENGSPLFPGIVGYDETVVPQLVNAILSRHTFILL